MDFSHFVSNFIINSLGFFYNLCEVIEGGVVANANDEGTRTHRCIRMICLTHKKVITFTKE